MRRVDVLVIGGGVAAARFVRTLRRGRYGGSILLVSDEAWPPYNRPPLSKEVLRGEAATELAFAEPLDWYERRQVELRLQTPVAALGPGERVAELADGEQIRFEHALLATGARPRPLSIPGGEAALLLRTLDDSATIRARAREVGAGGRAVMVGGGFIGVEVAASLAALGLSVTVLEAAGELWGGAMGARVGEWARQRLADSGVEVRLGAAADRVEASGVMVDGRLVDGSLLVAGVGVTPRTELAVAAGLGVDDGIAADERGATSAPEIYAAGDVARMAHPLDLSGRGIRVEHWHAAREAGERAALAIMGEPVAPRRAPWIYSEFAGQLVDHVGWAPEWDEERLLPGATERAFAVAFLRDGRVLAVASVNGAVPVDRARSFVERRPPASELSELVES